MFPYARRCGALMALTALISACSGPGGSGSPPNPRFTPLPTVPPTATPEPTGATPTPSPSPTRPGTTPTPTTPAASPTPSVAPTATPVATPTPAVLLDPSTLNFTQIGTTTTSSASEPGNPTATFAAATTTCSGVASVVRNGNVFSVTADGAGTCSYTITASDGHSTTLDVIVTITTGIIQARPATH